MLKSYKHQQMSVFELVALSSLRSTLCSFWSVIMLKQDIINYLAGVYVMINQTRYALCSASTPPHNLPFLSLHY